VPVDLPGLGDAGPDDLRSLLTATFALIPAGMLLGTLGHITQVRGLVAAGVFLVFAGGALFLVAVGQYG
jgi:hypothetical protein